MKHCYLAREDVIHTRNFTSLTPVDELSVMLSLQVPYDLDVAFSFFMLQNNIDVFVTNREDFGYLADVPEFTEY